MILAALLLLPLAATADPARRLAHYAHQRWTEGSEAPAPVLALAQGRDGFLWLATGEGLFRFDGMTFEPIEVARGDRSNVRPTALVVTRSGDVWTNFEGSRRFATYRQGRLRLAEAPAAPARILKMVESADGAIWALTAEHAASLLRYHKGAWRTFDARHGVPRDDALDLMVASDGAIWLALCNSVVRLPPGGDRFELVRETPGLNPRLSQDSAGRVWLSAADGSYPVTGPGGRDAAPRSAHPYPTDKALIRGAPMFDRSGNLWIATTHDGVQRVLSPQATGAPTATIARAAVESFGNREGLSSDVTYQMLEDREGNVWVASEKGLDKLRPSTLRVEPALSEPAAFGDKLAVGSDGSVYIGQADAIYRVRPGAAPEAILRGVSEPQAICEAPTGAIWIGFRDHVVVWSAGRSRRIAGRPESRSIMYDCAFDRNGDFWFSSLAGGLHRYRQGRWEAAPSGAGLRDPDPTTLVRDSRGRLVVQWNARTLAMIDPPLRHLAPIDFGKAQPDVLTLYATASGDLLSGGAFGLSRMRGDKIETIWASQPSPVRRINGLVQTPQGDLWIAYPRMLVRLQPTELEQAFANGVFAGPAFSLNLGSGMSSRTHANTQRSLVQGGDGRLWIATQTGTIWMDPGQIVRNPLAPPVAIRSLAVDGQIIRDPRSVTLEAGTSNLEIDYAALSFADPEGVSVRYILEGYDTEWVDPGSRRQAFYTNLSPGRYRFRVVAANEEGVWNPSGADLELTIPPTFLQSRWFLLLCLVATGVLATLLYRLRMAQVAGRIRSRLEERLGERERIARELHDTLIQSVQGLILRFQSVADKMPARDPSRAHLETALVRADEVLAEGRDRVQGLRLAEHYEDLSELLRQRAAVAGFDPAISIQVAVEGRPRPLQPMVAAEIDRIAREALFNVARHARARTVRISVSFASGALEVGIRDDGEGIPRSILSSGAKPGHFGLVGMRERAERMGASFRIVSSPDVGTTVTVRIPGRLAFADLRQGGSAERET